MIRMLSREDVQQALTMPEAISLMQEAFRLLSGREAVVPNRIRLEMEADQGCALIMPVYAASVRRLAVKMVSIMDRNPEAGLPLIHALLTIFDAENGLPLAIMDGDYLTALRTGAATGLATDLLAKDDARTVAIVGAGLQARFQLLAMCAVRPVERVLLLGRSREKAGRFATEMSDQLQRPVEVITNPEALRSAEIICAATTATSAVFPHGSVAPGTHINGVGAYKLGMCEIPAETLGAAKIVVDQRETCLKEAGDIIEAIRGGAMQEQHLHAELGEIVSGAKPGRESAAEITVFKSVGNAIQDLVCAARALQNAEALNLGTLVEI